MSASATTVTTAAVSKARAARAQSPEPGKLGGQPLTAIVKAGPIGISTKVVARPAKAKDRYNLQPSKSWGDVMHKYVSDNPVERHRHVMEGVKSKDFVVVLNTFKTLTSNDLLHSMGISQRTLQRKQDERLNPQHSNAAIALMEVTDQATRALGSREAAEKWLAQKAIALDGERPVDLLGSAPGIEAVKDLLTRIEYGVYA